MTMTSVTNVKRPGRTASRIAEQLRTAMNAGTIPAGQYLPGLRTLCVEYCVSFETVRRALKLLESEGWVASHRGHGFRVSIRNNKPENTAPIAFVLSSDAYGGRWSDFGQRLQTAIQRAAEKRGLPTLGVTASPSQPARIVQQLRTARASGLLLDTPAPGLATELLALNLPAVLIEDPVAETRWDCVTQDNVGGGMRMAAYLAERGHRRVGWYGILSPTVASRERWGGVLAGLRDTGACLAPSHTIAFGESDSTQRLREAMSGPDRPTGLLAPWWDGAVEAAHTLLAMGLTLGKDVDIVAWCPEEQLPEFRAAWPGEAMPATITWSMRQMAEAALDRLTERRERPDASPVRIIVEIRLREPQSAASTHTE